MPLLPQIPSMLVERGGASLEWETLRSRIAQGAGSPLGRAWIEALEPSFDAQWIEQQQQRTAEMRLLIAGGNRFAFAGLFDPAELLDRARIEGAALEPMELLTTLALAERVEAWRLVTLAPPDSVRGKWPAVELLSSPLQDHDLGNLLQFFRGKIEVNGDLSDDASSELRRIRRALAQQHRAIEDGLRRTLAKLAADGSTQDAVISVRGERFVIPVRAEFKRRVPGVLHGSSSTGQTVYIEPMETIEQNNDLVRLLDEEQAEVHRILVAMTRAVAGVSEALLLGTEILTQADAHQALAKFAEELRCVRPVFVADAEHRSEKQILRYAQDDNVVGDVEAVLRAAFSLLDARHPLLELHLQSRRADIVPLTIELPTGKRQMILSGPNTGGKTVALKTAGLLAIMAQSGLPVPAEKARLPHFTAIYADIGDAQSIESNLSTFSAHVTNVDRIARVADGGSLVLLDELGSATDPEEGAALAVAVAEHFLNANAWSLITTHLTSLKIYATKHVGVLNAAVGFDEETLTPTYDLRLGVPGASAGLNIAARLGMDASIIANARAQMSVQTADIGRFLDELHAQLSAANAERAVLAEREREVADERLRLEVEGRAEQKAHTKELAGKLDALIKDFEAQVREMLKAINDKTIAQKVAKDSALRVARLRREFSEQFQTTVLAHITGADKPADSASGHVQREPRAGDTVHLRSLGREARIMRIVDASTLEVSVGAMKMRVKRSDVGEVIAGPQSTKRRGGVSVATATGDADADFMRAEINVIGQTADEAESEVQRFLERAFLAGLPSVRIVHGVGMGVLRRTLREMLRSHPHVASIAEPAYNEGGQGATLVEMRH